MKVSVIIPTYNGERTIARALHSVLIQGVPAEILICDDRSTDRTLDIASNFPVKIIKNKFHTGGPNAGRNAGIRNATGDLIAFLDQDDEWLPGKLDKQIKEIKSGAKFVSSSSIIRMEYGGNE